jgi:phosphatidylglycerol---prolipoprotein diacylglyceryl transferase
MTPDYLVSFPGLDIHDIPVNRVAFSPFGLNIYWYGLLIAGALVLCLILAIRQAKANGLSQDDVMDTFIAIIPLMIIFARLYYVIFEWDFYSKDWRLIFDTRHGGLAFYGGVIGGVLAIALVTILKKIKVTQLMDFLVVYVPLGQAIGRWGNFFNQEAFGTNTNLPWGMYSNGTEAYLRTVSGATPTAPVHPTFLYEFIANLIIFAVLLRIRKRARFPLSTTLWYLLLYGFVRFFVEGIRTDALFIGDTSIRISQVLSAAMVIVSSILLIVLNRRKQRAELNAALFGDAAVISGDAAGEGESFIEISDDQAAESEILSGEPAGSEAAGETQPAAGVSESGPDDGAGPADDGAAAPKN